MVTHTPTAKARECAVLVMPLTNTQQRRSLLLLLHLFISLFICLFWDGSIHLKLRFLKKYFMCMGVLPECFSVHYVCALTCSERGIRCPGTGDSCEMPCRIESNCLGIKPRHSGRVARTLNHWAISKALQNGFTHDLSKMPQDSHEDMRVPVQKLRLG